MMPIRVRPVRRILVTIGCFVCAITSSAQEGRQEQEQAAAIRPAPAESEAVTGAHGEVILDGDATFTSAGAVMRSTSASKPYVVAQPSGSSSSAGFVVGPAAGQERFFVRNDGNVGVGTMVPSRRLVVFDTDTSAATLGLRTPASGSGANDGVDLQLAEGNAFLFNRENGFLKFGTNDATAVTITSAGNVGIGNDTPQTRLDVYGAALVYGSARRVARFFDTTPSAAGVGGGIDFVGRYHSNGAYTNFANIKGIKASAVDGDLTGHLVFSVENASGAFLEVARLTPAELAVTGNASFTGTVTGGSIEAHYQDVAEWVPAVGDLEPGAVVVIARGARNSVTASTAAYDARVAGVVSEQPGVLLGVPGESKVKVATTGRVKVKVDASRSAIDVGDLLVTSSMPGVAMKSEPIDLGGTPIHRPGTILGKALEPLAGGTGEILVLLSLQ